MLSDVCMSAPQQSQKITYEQLKEISKTRDFRINVSAVADGIYAANAALELQGKPPLFCPPL